MAQIPARLRKIAGRSRIGLLYPVRSFVLPPKETPSTVPTLQMFYAMDCGDDEAPHPRKTSAVLLGPHWRSVEQFDHILRSTKSLAA